jgi:ABC-type Fe3+/spermidine/putrescine transport system ATPase subunit
MATLRVDQLTVPLRAFRLQLRLEVGSTLALVGPSGAGKTTVLRAVAGLVRPESGRIAVDDDVFFDGERGIDLPPERRSVGLVFQEYALFPHMTVRQNVEYARRHAADEYLERFRIAHLEDARPHQLSGGERQRVALARALARDPQVLLLDEPLSALDLKIRLEMEEELRRVHRETGATFVYVTHDQREALALSDRIVVFDEGRIVQLGTPDEIYRRPSSPFAAQFVGDANVLPVEVVGHGGGRAAVALAGQSLSVPCEAELPRGDAWLVLRPEVVRLGGADGGGLRGIVRDLAFRGSGFGYRIEVPGLPDALKAEVPSEAGRPHELGSDVSVEFDPESCVLLPRAR